MVAHNIIINIVPCRKSPEAQRQHFHRRGRVVGKNCNLRDVLTCRHTNTNRKYFRFDAPCIWQGHPGSNMGDSPAASPWSLLMSRLTCTAIPSPCPWCTTSPSHSCWANAGPPSGAAACPALFRVMQCARQFCMGIRTWRGGILLEAAACQ